MTAPQHYRQAFFLQPSVEKYVRAYDIADKLSDLEAKIWQDTADREEYQALWEGRVSTVLQRLREQSDFSDGPTEGVVGPSGQGISLSMERSDMVYGQVAASGSRTPAQLKTMLDGAVGMVPGAAGAAPDGGASCSALQAPAGYTQNGQLLQQEQAFGSGTRYATEALVSEARFFMPRSATTPFHATLSTESSPK
jgi:hypothetical protein